jgi:hypothetical protein
MNIEFVKNEDILKFVNNSSDVVIYLDNAGKKINKFDFYNERILCIL